MPRIKSFLASCWLQTAHQRLKAPRMTTKTSLFAFASRDAGRVQTGLARFVEPCRDLLPSGLYRRLRTGHDAVTGSTTLSGLRA